MQGPPPLRNRLFNSVDREVAHGVVERQLLPGADRLAGDQVECLPVVEADTAVGVTGVVDLRPHAAVARPAAGTHLRRVRVVARQRPDQDADHDDLAGREWAGGQNPIALAVGRAAQLDAFVLGNLDAARLALREDRRSAATRRGGAGRPGRMNVGHGNPFRVDALEGRAWRVGARPDRPGRSAAVQGAGDGGRVRGRPGPDAHPRGRQGRQGRGLAARRAAQARARQEAHLVELPRAGQHTTCPSRLRTDARDVAIVVTVPNEGAGSGPRGKELSRWRHEVSSGLLNCCLREVPPAPGRRGRSSAARCGSPHGSACRGR